MNIDVIKEFPHAVGPEKSVLSSMLQDPAEFIGQAIEQGITDGHFYLPSHQTIYEEMVKRYDRNDPVELVSFVQSLLDTGRLDRVGGPATLTDIYTYAPSPGQFDYHLQTVKDKFAMRCLLNFCANTEQAVWEEPEEINELLDSAEASLMAIREGRDPMKVKSIKEAVQSVVDDFRARLGGKSDIKGMSTGFADLDRKIGGLKPGEVFVIAARPSMGKTSFMMNIVEHVALDLEEPVMVFSCEMTQEKLVERLVYSRARLNPNLLEEGYQPTKGELQRLQAVSLAVARSGLIIDDTASIPISQLRAKARRKKREKGIKLIAIDYIQLMKSLSKQALNSREREIAEISASIKGLAKELNIPIILLAQLNRGPENRGGEHPGKPRLSDLRESGAIEQDADQVGLLYRPAYYIDDECEKEATAGEAELILAKNRNGATGTVPLTFIETLMRFENGKTIRMTDPPPVRDWVR